MAQHGVIGDLKFVERAQADVRKICIVALQSILVARTTLRILGHRIVLQGRVSRVEAALVWLAKRPIDVSQALFVSLAGSLEVFEGLYVALVIEFEDSSV